MKVWRTRSSRLPFFVFFSLCVSWILVVIPPSFSHGFSFHWVIYTLVLIKRSFGFEFFIAVY